MKIPSLKSVALILGVLLVGGSIGAAGSPSSGATAWTKGRTSFLFGSLRTSASSPCVKTAQDLHKSCQLGANADYYLALAICENLLSSAERSACAREAGEESRDALDECGEQNAARLDVCEELGGAAYQPFIDPDDFVEEVDNPFFPLRPGTMLVYESHTPDGLERQEMKITRDTKTILGVSCVVVHDVVTLDGEVVEDTLDWYAQDRAGNVWYFGEESKDYEDGELVSLGGSWKAGRDGAQPGIIMEAHPQVGDLYRQEFMPGEAEDLARVAGLNASVVVPYGSFTGLLATQDFSPLEPGIVEQKFYAPGIGTVLEIGADGGRNELVDIIPPPTH